MISKTNSPKPATDAPQGGFRQSMSWLHTWAGLTLGWVLYFIFLTGTAGYFDSEIDRWMRPELPPAPDQIDTAQTSAKLVSLLEQQAVMAERWFITLPADRNQPYAGVFWHGASEEAGAHSARGDFWVNDSTGEILDARDTGGGHLLYRMHWRLHYLPTVIADSIVGFASLFMLIAIITGIIVHKKILKDFFTFRPGKGQRSWLDGHNVLSVVALPFHLMITYSGLVFMGFSYMPLIETAHYGPETGTRSQFVKDVFDPPGLVEAAGEQAPLVSLHSLIATAEKRWGEGRIRSIDIRHPGDRNARIIFYENIEQSVASGGERLIFDGASGELLHTVPRASSSAKSTRDLLIGLHEGLFAPPLLRWLYFFSGLLGCGMIATGLVLWTSKRRQQAQRKNETLSTGLKLVEKLNVGTVVGLPIGIALYFWANRLLPVNMEQRADWEAHIMFVTWLLMLIHAAIRSNQRAWVEQLAIAALVFGGLPLLNMATTDRHLGHSLASGDWVFAGFDLTMLATGLVCTWVAWCIGHVRNHSATAAGQVVLRGMQ